MLLFFILLAIIFKDYNGRKEMDGREHGKFKIMRTQGMSLCCFLG